MFQNLRLTIGRKIFASFIVLMVLFTINAVIIFNTSRKIDVLVNFSTEVIRPSTESIQNIQNLLARSRMLITNWVYLPSNNKDKADLKLLLNTEYPAVKKEISELYPKWESDTLKFLMQETLKELDLLLKSERDEIMLALVTFDDYEDPIIRFSVDDKLETEIIPKTSELTARLAYISQEYDRIRQEADDEMATAMESLSNITIILTVFLVLVSLGSALVLIRIIKGPINQVKDVFLKLSKGEIDTDDSGKVSNDEIGDMRLAVRGLISGLRETADFAEKIGKGDYKAEFTPLSNKDVLGNALLDMRSNLKRVSAEGEIRRWTNEGVAMFAELMRNHSTDVEELSRELIRNLVKYLGANQGGIYLVKNDELTNDEVLVLASCYAWDKEKFIDQKWHRGEGLAGQVWIEGLSVYLTDVPQDYVKITSGLGTARPDSVFICPVKLNDLILGIIEIAAFGEIEEYKREFLEKLGESIASTVNNVQNSVKTRALLEESQIMTEQMRSQEEEMRQNMEEITATQEEMERNQVETLRMMEAINKSVINIELTPEGRVDGVNNIFLTLVGYPASEVYGETFKAFYAGEGGQERFRSHWKELQAGNDVSGEFELSCKDGSTKIVKGTFVPTIEYDGSLIKVLFFGVDISEIRELT